MVTILILYRGKCALSKSAARYLIAMAVADLLIIFFDLIWRHIASVYRLEFSFLLYIPVCNIHAVVLYTVTDYSVWFTVGFTFDRYIAICVQKLKTKYCMEKTATVVLATIALLFSLKNTFWYFMFTSRYELASLSWLCYITTSVAQSEVWGAIEFVHYILTPCIPFVVILLFNALTVRYILVTNRARSRLRSHGCRECPSDPEMDSRRKSIIILYAISGNFILLWAVSMIHNIYWRMVYLGYETVYLPVHVREVGFMLQLLSCCTNTAIYAITQRKFREELKYLFSFSFITNKK
ncbi:probable G-protein coupled receptor 139 [Chiloscyllium punctatum]|uniref:probable G-protein coupled receptor 139 n=1 Tax=Chiloscyllium punctatum TaxID=137246 RepID=UPI003B634719